MPVFTLGRHSTDEILKASGYVADRYLPALSKQDETASAMHAPFNVAFNTDLPYFEWLEQPGNEHRLKRFGPAMTGTAAWEVPGAIVAGKSSCVIRGRSDDADWARRFPMARSPKRFASRRCRGRHRFYRHATGAHLPTPQVCHSRQTPSCRARDGCTLVDTLQGGSILIIHRHGVSGARICWILVGQCSWATTSSFLNHP